MDAELAALEERLELLLAHVREMRAANELLRRELLASQERNRDLSARVAQASRGAKGAAPRAASEGGPSKAAGAGSAPGGRA
jgi:hypothetical protein